ncbi:alpha/beta hydrolase [Actinomadura scrupuli]|uniref:alpha/beta hydrolase n=1 Tax=Actinomadura scrupuli TaxID=559629 RepID=UPI003D99BAAA
MDTPPATLVIERNGGASWRSRALGAGVGAVVRRRANRVKARTGTVAGFGPDDLRRLAALDRLAGYAPLPRGTHVERVRLDGFGAEWVHGTGVGPDRDHGIMLYFHGGAWVTCGLNTHRRLVSRLSAAAGVPALSVDYRMVPAVPFEAEVEDCLTSYEWLLDQGVRPQDVVVAGDSAGGYMSFAMTLLARERGLPLPAGIVALSPMLDMDLTAKLEHRNARLDPTAPMEVLELLVEFLLPGADLADPRISPIQADLRGLPPALISASSTEILYCDAERMAHRLAAAGVPCTLKVWDRQLHVFQALGPLLPESRAAIAELGAFTAATLAGSAAASSAPAETPCAETS